MARSLTAGVQSEIDKFALSPINLYTLAFPSGTGLLLTEHDTNITFAGLTYTAFPVSHEPIKNDISDSIDRLRVRVGPSSFIINQVFQQQGLRNTELTVTTVFEDLLSDPNHAVVRFNGFITRSFGQQDGIAFEATSKLDVQDIKIPGRVMRKDSCAWRFKGVGCQYVGALPTCDKTLEGVNGCRTHDNLIHFGGFPSIIESRQFII